MKPVAVGIRSHDARRELVSRTPKTATEVALFGRLLTVTSLNGVKILIFDCFMGKINVLVIVYIFVVAGNYVDFCPRTIHNYHDIFSVRIQNLNRGYILSGDYEHEIHPQPARNQ